MSYNKLKEYVIPDGVTTVREGQVPHFEVGSVKIPNSVTKIGHHAFYCCVDLKSIEIPSSVEHISPFVFEGCKDLTIICEKGSYAEHYAKREGIPVSTDGKALVATSKASPDIPSHTHKKAFHL